MDQKKKSRAEQLLLSELWWQRDIITAAAAAAADFDDLTWTLCVPPYNAEEGREGEMRATS